MIELLADPATLLFVFGGVLISIWGVVIGGSMFASVPFLQILFPGVSFGQIVGNIKVGSLFRSIAFVVSAPPGQHVKKLIGRMDLYTLFHYL